MAPLVLKVRSNLTILKLLQDMVPELKNVSDLADIHIIYIYVGESIGRLS